MDHRPSDKPSALQRAVEEGIDLSLLYERLSWSPTERIERHRQALDFVNKLKEARKRKHDGRRKTP
jgi:hypothetical protein